MTWLAKAMGQLMSLLLILPFWLTFHFASLLRTADESLVCHSQLLSLIPGKLGTYLRVAFYRLVLDACDPTACIEFGVLFSKTGAIVGKHVYIGPYSQIGLATIDDDTLIGSAVQIPSGPCTHGFDRLDCPIRLQPGQPQRVTIGRDCWIGAGSIILADVSPQSVVGAGSIVTKVHPPRSVIAGNPGLLLRSRALDQVSMEESFPGEGLA